eukprot:720835_1
MWPIQSDVLPPETTVDTELIVAFHPETLKRQFSNVLDVVGQKKIESKHNQKYRDLFVSERFDEKTCNENVTISKNGREIIQTVAGNTSIFGSTWIESSDCRIYKWEFNIIKKKNEYFAIGIAKNDSINNKSFWTCKEQLAYVLYHGGQILKTNCTKWQNYCSGFKQGST